MKEVVGVENREGKRMDIEKLRVELEEYGFVVIHNLIPADQAEHMTNRLMEIMRQQPDKDMPNQNLRGVFNYDDQDTFIPLVTHPVYLELAAHMLGPGFQMAEVGARWIKPGAEAQGLHADVPIGWFPQSGLTIPDACFLVNCIWMLTDFTLENGATQVMPFSHHSRRTPRSGVEYNHLVTAEGPRGFYCYFSRSHLASRGSQRHYGRTPHGCVKWISCLMDGSSSRGMVSDEEKCA